MMQKSCPDWLKQAIDQLYNEQAAQIAKQTKFDALNQAQRQLEEKLKTELAFPQFQCVLEWEEVRQITVATGEQAKQGENIVRAVENVASQAAMVTQAAKEQAIGVEEIIKGVVNAREQVRQITAATVEQAKHGQDIVKVVGNLTKQAAEITEAAKFQTKETNNLEKAISEAKRAAERNIQDAGRMVAVARELADQSSTIKNSLRILI